MAAANTLDRLFGFNRLFVDGVERACHNVLQLVGGFSYAEGETADGESTVVLTAASGGAVRYGSGVDGELIVNDGDTYTPTRPEYRTTVKCIGTGKVRWTYPIYCSVALDLSETLAGGGLDGDGNPGANGGLANGSGVGAAGAGGAAIAQKSVGPGATAAPNGATAGSGSNGTHATYALGGRGGQGGGFAQSGTGAGGVGGTIAERPFLGAMPQSELEVIFQQVAFTSGDPSANRCYPGTAGGSGGAASDGTGHAGGAGGGGTSGLAGLVRCANLITSETTPQSAIRCRGGRGGDGANGSGQSGGGAGGQGGGAGAGGGGGVALVDAGKRTGPVVTGLIDVGGGASGNGGTGFDGTSLDGAGAYGAVQAGRGAVIAYNAATNTYTRLAATDGGTVNTGAAPSGRTPGAAAPGAAGLVDF